MLEWIVSASALITAVLISRRLLKGRVRYWVQYSLWLLVALRLLIPVSPVESVFSVANLLPENRTEQETEAVSGQSGAGASYGAHTDENRASFQGAESGTLTTDMTAHAAGLPEESAGARSRRTLPAESVDNPSADEAAGGKRNIVIRFLTALWLAGGCLMALWLVTVNAIFRRKVQKSREVLEIPKELRIQLQSGSAGGRKKPRLLPVYVTDQVQTPCMYGLLYPAIYVTPRTAGDPEVLAMVLRHEQMHYHHGDHFWAVVRALCLCIHWYHPLVWAAAGISRQDGELACDEGVMRQLGEGSRRYGEALLALSAEQRFTRGMSMNLATSMSGTGRQLKERLSALVKIPRMAAGTAVLVAVLSLGLMACTFTGRQQGESEGNTAAEDTDTTDLEKPIYGDSEEQEREENTELQESREEPQYELPWVFAEEYTGYLDECTAVTWSGITWQEIYADQDYDGDGFTDRIYQDVESEPGVMKIRVEFGNGEILAFDTYMNSPLIVQSMDLDGDGSPELLFTKPNGFSTNPMGIATDILLFTRQEDGYRQVEIPLEDVAEEYRTTSWEADLILSYEKADDTHIRVYWRVPGAGGDLGETQEVLREASEDTIKYYRSFFGQSYPKPAYDAKLIQERYAFLRLYVEGLSRSGDYVQVDMGLENGQLYPIDSTYVYWDSEQAEDNALPDK